MAKPVSSSSSLVFPNTRFSEDYWETLFMYWYRNGRPKGTDLLKNAPRDRFGRVPTLNILSARIRKYEWHKRADALDEEVSRRVQQKAIEEKVAMLERQAEFGKELQMKGFEYLQQHKLTKEETAIKAIIQGAELERASRGIPQALIKVAEMQNEELSSMVQKLLMRINPNEVEDLSENISKDIIDGEYVEDGKE